MNRYTVIFLVAILALTSCRPGIPRQYIQPNELEDILYDYHMAQAMASQKGGTPEERDYNSMLYFAAVLQKYGLTREDFDSSMVYYYRRADRLEPIYKRVAKRLSDEALKWGATEGEVNRFTQFSADGDTANVWEGPSAIVLMPYAMYNRLDFSIAGDSTYRKGDTFMLTFNLDFHYQSGSKESVACLTLVYDNDSVDSRVAHLSYSGNNQLRMTPNEANAVKEIKGYIYLGKGNETSTTLKLLFMRDIRLIRLHKHEKTGEKGLSDSLTSPGPVPSEIRSTDTAHIRHDSLRRHGRPLPLPPGKERPAIAVESDMKAE